MDTEWVAVSHEPRSTWGCSKTGIGRRDPPLEPQREQGPGHTFISDFWPPGR